MVVAAVLTMMTDGCNGVRGYDSVGGYGVGWDDDVVDDDDDGEAVKSGNEGVNGCDGAGGYDNIGGYGMGCDDDVGTAETSIAGGYRRFIAG